ncbi:histone H2B.11-like [Iris pallida]|uniref:Histone H2B.11-like n=1 Tax=Iris pallida TaxID=29817 RepID=A0AAX6ET23_IRIPA|nr:histone H2B.11-like [Iris pallida]
MAPKAEKKPAEKKPAAAEKPAEEEKEKPAKAAEKAPPARSPRPRRGSHRRMLPPATSRRRRREGEERGDLQDLHLQGPEAGPPGHRDLEQGHGDHELLHQRHLREARRGVVPAGQVQQEAHRHFPRDPDLRPPRPPWGARQARRVRRDEGGDQVHQLLEM